MNGCKQNNDEVYCACLIYRSTAFLISEYPGTMMYPKDTVSTVNYDKLYTDILETKCYLHLSENRVNSTHAFLLDITV